MIILKLPISRSCASTKFRGKSVDQLEYNSTTKKGIVERMTTGGRNKKRKDGSLVVTAGKGARWSNSYVCNSVDEINTIATQGGITNVNGKQVVNAGETRSRRKKDFTALGGRVKIKPINNAASIFVHNPAHQKSWSREETVRQARSQHRTSINIRDDFWSNTASGGTRSDIISAGSN